MRTCVEQYLLLLPLPALLPWRPGTPHLQRPTAALRGTSLPPLLRCFFEQWRPPAPRDEVISLSPNAPCWFPMYLVAQCSSALNTRNRCLGTSRNLVRKYIEAVQKSTRLVLFPSCLEQVWTKYVHHSVHTTRESPIAQNFPRL